jgi:HAE1 family hydrophobic/amphiphilic exporter-1
MPLAIGLGVSLWAAPAPAQETPAADAATIGIVGQSPTGPTDGKPAPDASAAERLRKQAENEERVGVTAGRSTPLSMREAILMALSRNADVEIQRITVQQAAYDVNRARGIYDLNLSGQVNFDARRIPTTSLIGGATNGAFQSRTGTQTFTADQTVKSGGRLSFAFNNTRQTTDNILAGLSPQFTSLIGATFAQPLFRNREIDEGRRQILLSKKRLSLSDSQFRQRVIDSIAAVQAAYWDLVFAKRDVEIKEESVNLARTQLEQNRRFVEAGTLAPVEIVSVEAQLEQRQEDLLISLEQLTRAENVIKTLVLESRTASMWNEALNPTDSVTLEPVNIPVAEAVAAALRNRPEMEQFDLQKESNDVDVRYFKNQIRPQIDFIGSYSLQSLSGTPQQISGNPFSGGFNTAVLDRLNALSSNAGLGAVVIPPQQQIPGFFVGGFGTSLQNLFQRNFYDVRVGVSFTFQAQNRAAKANYGRALAQERLIATQRAKTEAVIEGEVRNALQSVQTALKRVQAARASRTASEAQLASEVRRYEVGESTNFLVLERQSALSTARGREIRALTDYNKAIVALQRAMSTTLAANRLEMKPGKDSSDAQSVVPEIEPKP